MFDMQSKCWSKKDPSKKKKTTTLFVMIHGEMDMFDWELEDVRSVWGMSEEDHLPLLDNIVYCIYISPLMLSVKSHIHV